MIFLTICGHTFALKKILHKIIIIIIIIIIINDFKNKIDCCSIMDTVGLRVPSKQVETFPPLMSVLSQTL
jgi:hypothetical protein